MGLGLLSTRSGAMGRWTIAATPAGGPTVDVTIFRGSPVSIESLSWTDPFGPAAASISIPQVSVLERVPGADTWWLRHGTRFEIVFTVEDPDIAMAAEQLPDVWRSDGGTCFSWEGFLVSRNWYSSGDASGLRVELAGAMRALDARVAQRVVFNRPTPYEDIIAHHFAYADRVYDTDLAPLRIDWPDWWDRYYVNDPELPAYLRPRGVEEGEPWSGMTAREAGRWDPVLSSAIGGLLSVMFTERGQFTLALEHGRRPVLRHRDRPTSDRPDTLHVDAAWPGVGLDLSEDASQTAHAIYGTARSSMSGTTYSGLRYALDGSYSEYEPFAELKAAEGRSYAAEAALVRRELYIEFTDGLTPAEAMAKARSHLQRNGTPGLVGTVALAGVHPLMQHGSEMVVVPAAAIRAGSTIRVHGLRGDPDGALFTVAQAEHSPNGNTTTLTVDTEHRDYMTVREVMERGRDALRPWHMMTVGKYNVNIPDAMMPWNYAEGSGYIPYESFESGFWDGCPSSVIYPWEEWTVNRPPKLPAWASSYIKVPAVVRAADGPSDPSSNWNRPTNSTNDHCFVLLAQAGEIALLQIAAYDVNGRVKKVPFHVSVWASNNASANSAPKLHADTEVTYTDEGERRTITYKDGEPYPFFEDAWEQYRTDGSVGTWVTDLQPNEDGLLVGYGNHWEKAGYWPHSGRSEGSDLAFPGQDVVRAQPTGMLVDESPWGFDLSGYASFSPNEQNDLFEHGSATVLIYCESDTDTYFVGRLFRKEYGS